MATNRDVICRDYWAGAPRGARQLAGLGGMGAAAPCATAPPPGPASSLPGAWLPHGKRRWEAQGGSHRSSAVVLNSPASLLGIITVVAI